MPKADEQDRIQTLQQVVAGLARYPIEAFSFLQAGLEYSVKKTHGPRKSDTTISRHITGQQLCEGLREYARLRWGLLARTVLDQWNIRATVDFGRMVFALVENSLLQKTDEDTIDDFRDVYDFRSLDEDYSMQYLSSIKYREASS